MKFLVIGATRGLGRRLAELAYKSGHEVTLLTRHYPQNFPQNSKRLHMIRGDILDHVAVSTAVQGQHAVCICIGTKPTLFKPINVFSQGTQVVIEAMKLAGVKRLVCVTGIGAGDSRGHGGFTYDKFVQPFMLRTVYADKTLQEEKVRESGLDWTIVRPGFLTNGPSTRRYRVISELKGITARKVSRSDVAIYLMHELATGIDTGKTLLIDGP